MLTLLRAVLPMIMFFSWEKEIHTHGARLPHWEQEEGTPLRDARHFGNALRYVRNNPVKACLRPDEYTLWEEVQEQVNGGS